CHVIQKRPETSSDNFLRDFGERFVPGYKVVSAVDLFLNGAFDEKKYHQLFANAVSNLQIISRAGPASGVFAFVTFRRKDSALSQSSAGAYPLWVKSGH